MSTAVPTQPDSRFLQRPALAALRHLRFVPRQRVDGGHGGRHRSRRQGGAAEFVDYREYAAGEDLRRLDWKVLARTGRPFVRLYRDEADLRLTLLLDGSASMDFGPPPGLTKLAWAQFVATAISELIVRQQDQVGVAIANDGLAAHLSPGGTAGHARRVQQAIEAVAPKPASKLDAALGRLYTEGRRRGTLLVLSDFLLDDLDAVFSQLRLFRASHWDVLLLHVVHPQEERLPDGVAWRFDGCEGEAAIDCSPAEVAADYAKRFGAHCSAVRQLAVAAGCDYRRASTATPYLRVVGDYLVPRGG